MLTWKNTISWTVFLLFLALLIFSAENINKNQRCKNINIQLERKAEGDFVTVENINNLLTENGNTPILGAKFNLLNFNRLEKNILKNKLVKNCQISRTLGGDLVVKVQQQDPIARIVAIGVDSEKFRGLYVDEEGNFFPLSSNFTKRVVLLSGKYLIGKHNLKSKNDKNLLDFVNGVVNDHFWNANITHIIVNEDENIIFSPLIGNLNFEYGIPKEEEFEQKMKKIEIYYQQIEPENNGKYKMVSVKYKNQIVCQLNQQPTI